MIGWLNVIQCILLKGVLDVDLPDASFYLWARVPERCAGGSDGALIAVFACAWNEKGVG